VEYIELRRYWVEGQGERQGIEGYKHVPLAVTVAALGCCKILAIKEGSYWRVAL
jgi:hypothetical protein